MRIPEFLRAPAFRPIALAYATTALSKVATIGVQLAALPIVASSLGQERFGALLAIGALSSLVSTPGVGMAPVASQGVAVRLGRGDAASAKVFFWNQFFLGVVIALSMLVLSLLLAVLGDPRHVLGQNTEPFAGEVRGGIIAAGFHLFLFYSLGFIDGVRAAHAENHITNTFSFLGSCVAILGCAVAAHQQVGSIALYYVFLFATPIALQGFNLLSFLAKYREHFRHIRLSLADMREISTRVFHYMQTQLGLSLLIQAPVYLAGRYIGLDASATIGAVARLFSLVHSSLWTLANPILPLLSRALAVNNLQQARQIGTLTAAGFIGIAVCLGLVFGLCGAWILEIWLDLGAGQPARFFWLAGLFFLLFSGLHMTYLILVASGSVGRSHTFLLLGGAIAVAVAVLIGRGADLSELVAVNCLCMAIVSAPPMLRQLHRVLNPVHR